MNPKEISIQDFTYSLPEEKIAKYPLPERDASRLLIYQDGNIAEDVYQNLARHIPAGSLIIFNDTKVIEARLLFQKVTGGMIEIFCLAPHEDYADITTAMLQKNKVRWQCLVGGASKWKHGQVLKKKIQWGNEEIILFATFVEKRSDCFIIELSWLPVDLSFAEVLHYAGAIPLPPYIKRAVEKDDAERYQTIYAHFDGSVAAPTAGLHFTSKIFENLKIKNIRNGFITLHVGAGTFKPVKSETMQGHGMHSELINVSKKTIQNILDNVSNNIIAVGTTSLRTIESLYWLGVKLLIENDLTKKNEYPKILLFTQWEAYALEDKNIPVKDALQKLLAWMETSNTDHFLAKTQILIAPGYQTKIAKALITNFHQPQSTLLLLVAAFIGNKLPVGRLAWKEVYEYALQNDFRFLSYGDGSLLWRSE